MLPSGSLKKSGNLVCLFLPSTLFSVFRVSFILNLFNSISAVIWDFLAARSKLFNMFLYLVYLSLFSVAGLVMNFYKFIFSSNRIENACGYPWFSNAFTGVRLYCNH